MTNEADHRILVCLPPMAPDALRRAIHVVRQALPGGRAMLGLAEATGDADQVVYTEARTQTAWSLAAVDYLAVGRLAQAQNATGALLLGCQEPTVELISSLARGLTDPPNDVVVPILHPGLEERLVSAGLLYPMTAALFGNDIRFPLAGDVGLSMRAVGHFLDAARLQVIAGKGEDLLWPVSVAAGFRLCVREVEVREHTLPVPRNADLRTLFQAVVDSFFGDVETRAIVWQRVRLQVTDVRAPGLPGTASVTAADAEGALQAVSSFRSAYAHLLPAWQRVLPPQTLLAIKKLAQTPATALLFPARLWARIVYDFALAFHLRTLSPDHVADLLMPLYNAWKASYLRNAAGDADRAEAQVRELAAVFKAELPYFVARWRWPDRFNP